MRRGSTDHHAPTTVGYKKMAKNGTSPTFDPTDEQIEEIAALAGLGLTKYLLQNYFEVSSGVWLNAEKRNPKLKKAFNRGQAKTIAFASKKLYELIQKGNLNAIMFYLKTRAGWSERYNPELDCNVTEPSINITVSDPIEAAKIYQSIMKGGVKK